MSGLGGLPLVALMSLSVSACAAKRPVAAQPVTATCVELADHLAAVAVQGADDDGQAAARRLEAERMKVGCAMDNRLSTFAPVVQCLMSSTTMDAVYGCQRLDEDDEFSDYMGSILDLGAAAAVAPPTCSEFTASLARLRHLELDDMSDLQGDELSAAHADIDASTPAFDRACTENNQLPQYAGIAQCLNRADSKETLDVCVGYPDALAFEAWLGELIEATETAE